MTSDIDRVKAHYSLSDSYLHGLPKDFDVTVRSIQFNAGVWFLDVLTGHIIGMS